jgi:quercetin 2,3-dioxygenase
MFHEYRDVKELLKARDTADGAGVKLRRSLGSDALEYLDPFLMLDEFKSADANDYIAGFPDHPHRGFETVTYMLAGSFEHRDHMGNHGILGPGSAQWMTAGRGVVHSEMPLQKEGLVWGFQLWVNLPQAEKMCEPRYQDIAAREIPEVNRPDGTRIRVVAGSVFGVEGPVKGIVTDPLFLDVRVPAGVVADLTTPRGHAAIAYVFEGGGRIGGSKKEKGLEVGAGILTTFGDGEVVHLEAGLAGLSVLLIAAVPINEPVARYGPFVMNTREEIRQAFEEYRAGTFLL